MSEQNTFVASDETVGRNRKPNRKEPKQISFRVSESEYLKLQQSAETLNMSVPAFVKKKAQGSRLVAPKFDKEALDILTQKKNIRLLEIDMTIDNSEQELVSVSGGYLVQDKDNVKLNREDMTVVTEVEPTKAQWDAMLLGWKVVASVKSNAVILSNAKQTVGIGAGQMNRVGSAQIAIERAIEINDDVAMVSDGFFPMDDTVELAANSGIKAIIQPGGSIKDQESIDMANKHGIAMVTTGVRHFKH